MLAIWLSIAALISVSLTILTLAVKGVTMGAWDIALAYLGGAVFPIVVYFLIDSFFIKEKQPGERSSTAMAKEKEYAHLVKNMIITDPPAGP